MAALGVVTGVFGLGGLLGTEVTAYATALLAFGTVGLAAGAIGTYVEQRRANQQQAGQLQRRKVADIAQVQVERLSGPDELAKIAVTNGSERAIRNVHVWVEVRGMTGHYGTGVQKDDGSQARGMSHVLHDGELHWQLRTLRPGQREVFSQLTHMIRQPVSATSDSDITAFAECTDADGQWWRCDQDGEVIRRQPRDIPQGPGGLMLETGIRRIHGLARGVSPRHGAQVVPDEPGPRWPAFCDGAAGQWVIRHGLDNAPKRPDRRPGWWRAPGLDVPGWRQERAAAMSSAFPDGAWPPRMKRRPPQASPKGYRLASPAG